MSKPSGFLVGQGPRPDTAWVLDRDEHMLTIGATRSGKTRRLILPSMGVIGSVARESMYVNDMKGELYQHTAEWLSSRGYDIIRIDIRTPATGMRFNPVCPVSKALETGHRNKAVEMARNIAYTVVYGSKAAGATTDDKIWSDSAVALITALILAVAQGVPPDSELIDPNWAWPTEEQKNMSSVYAALLSGPERLDALFAQFPPDHPAYEAYGPVLMTGGSAKTRAGVLFNAAAALEVWADSDVKWLTSNQDIDLTALGKRPTALFLVVPDESKIRYALVTLFLQQTIQALVEFANQNGGRLPIRVNFLLDEFGNFPPIDGFDTVVTMAAGRGIKLCLVVQSLTQAKKAYKDAADTITGNCGTWVYIMTQDLDTLKQLSALCGNYTTYGESNSIPKVYWTSTTTPGHSTNTVNLMSRPLIEVDELRRFPADQCLVLQIGKFPAKLALPDLSSWSSVWPEIQQKRPDPPEKPMEPVSVWRPPSASPEEGTPVEEMGLLFSKKGGDD